jgi:hypothetical protein
MNGNGQGRKRSVHAVSSQVCGAATCTRPRRVCSSLTHCTASCSAPAFTQTHLDIWVWQSKECVGSEPTCGFQGCAEYSWSTSTATLNVSAWSSWPENYFFVCLLQRKKKMAWTVSAHPSIRSFELAMPIHEYRWIRECWIYNKNLWDMGVVLDYETARQWRIQEITVGGGGGGKAAHFFN